jgi:hypothetical protein
MRRSTGTAMKPGRHESRQWHARRLLHVENERGGGSTGRMQHCPHGGGAELEIIAAILERLEAGLESAVQLDKPGFIGREALLAARGQPLRKKLAPSSSTGVCVRLVSSSVGVYEVRRCLVG